MSESLRRSRRQERAVADSLRGRTQPASGADPTRKGDVRNKNFLVECKRTDKGAISVKASWVRKICNQAARDKREPLIVLDIGDERVYLLPQTTFEFYIGEGEIDDGR